MKYPLPVSICLAALLFSSLLHARDTVIPVEGLHENTPRVHALAGATLVLSPEETLDEGIILLRDGIIEAAGERIRIPEDARVWDLSGKTIYAGFIDAYTRFGMPDGLKPPKPRDPYAEGPPPKKTPTPEQPGPGYWNALVTPERDAIEFYKASSKDAKTLNDLGFTTVATFPARGIFRGQGAIVNLNGKPIGESLIESRIAQHIAFELATRDPNASKAAYPNSLMGCIALIRQAFYDSDWQVKNIQAYERNAKGRERPVENAALAALKPLIEKKEIGLFQAQDELDYQRIGKIASEFSLDHAILGNGYEYRRLEILRDSEATVILPLAFPKSPQVERYGPSLDISLERLQHWNLAPSNPAFLAENDISFCISSYSLANPAKDFWNHLRVAVQRGLSPSDALAAITTIPAKTYGVEDRLGSIEQGKIANLVVSNGDLFTDKAATIEALWIDGEYLEKEAARRKDIEGQWAFDWKGVDGFASGRIAEADGKLALHLDEKKISIEQSEKEIRFSLEENELGGADKRIARLQAYTNDSKNLKGEGWLADGTRFEWTASRTEAVDTEEHESNAKKENEKEAPPPLRFDRYPAGAFGVATEEGPNSILVKQATVWTSGPEGRLEQADLLIRQGKIARIGRNLSAPKGALVIDGTGKHITPGLIDCHSHTAMSRGVNESGNAITVEVRVADIINPVDINLYRQLAGGLTTANLLHGSANPMGGQNQVIKLRWGEDAEAMKFEGARPGVKFALGENVKQSNKGDRFTIRYPQTRMGVEQFMESYFRAAADYERQWSDFRRDRNLPPPRRDIRLDATLEILNGDRDVHIHSYRQDEILMFARLAQRLDLKVAAFQHILEGYKVADAMADIQAGASTFSDWWAYKFEVYDAIPYNGAIMHRAGIITSFNSDDAELATRMNTEAAKAVKYGGLSEEEALKFVTLNPAIQLGVEDRVGSLEPGKDADFVIWNAHPLSTYAMAEQTWIDGIRRFDRATHRQRLQADLEEREALIQKALAGSSKGDKKPVEKPQSNDAPESSPGVHLGHQDEWIYHNGDRHYSCSGLDEEGHH